MKRSISDDALKRVAAHTPKEAWDEGLHDPGDFDIDPAMDDYVDLLYSVVEQLRKVGDALSPMKDVQTTEHPNVEPGYIAYFEQYIDDIDEIAESLRLEAVSLETEINQKIGPKPE